MQPHHVLICSFCCKDLHVFSPVSRKNSFQVRSQHIGNPLLLRLSWCLSVSQQVIAASRPPPHPRLVSPSLPSPNPLPKLFFFLSCVSAQPQGLQVIHPLSHTSKHTYLPLFFFFSLTHIPGIDSHAPFRGISRITTHTAGVLNQFQTSFFFLSFKKKFFLTWIKLFFCARVCSWSLCRPSGGHLD